MWRVKLIAGLAVVCGAPFVILACGFYLAALFP